MDNRLAVSQNDISLGVDVDHHPAQGAAVLGYVQSFLVRLVFVEDESTCPDLHVMQGLACSLVTLTLEILHGFTAAELHHRASAVPYQAHSFAADNISVQQGIR